MLQEMDVKSALNKFLSGEKVKVLQGDEEIGYKVLDLGDVLGNAQNHYLVDLPTMGQATVGEGKELPPAKNPRMKKINDEVAEKMFFEGKTQKEIAAHFDVSPSAVYAWEKRRYLTEDGNKCGTCKYRDSNKNKGSCNYLSIVGHSRGCSVEKCTVYEKGDPKEKIYGKQNL